MTKTKRSKILPIAIALSIVMTLSVMIGATYAWFSDREASGTNRIVGGNLDVELYWADWTENGVGQFARVTEETDNIFDSTELYEPGHTTVKYFKVVNAGTLALKYQLSMLLGDNEIPSVNMAGETFYLSEHMVFKFVDLENAIDNDEVYADREAAWAAALNGADAMTQLGFNNPNITGRLLPGANAEHYYALIVFMPTAVGNEANYRGDTAPQVTFDINLVASQTPHENDSFGDNYDQFADMTPDNEWSPFNVVTGNLHEGIQVFDDENVMVLNIRRNQGGNATVTAAQNTVPSGIAVIANNTYVCYEIDLELEDGQNPGDGSYFMTMLAGKGLSLDLIRLYHGTEDITDSCNLAYDTSTGYITFETASLSPFTIAVRGVIGTVDNVALEDAYSLKQAVELTPEGKTLVLTAAKIIVENDEKVVVDKNITIDVHGCMITAAENVDSFITINAGAQLTLKDSSNGHGIVSMNGGIIVDEQVGGIYTSMIKNDGTLILNGGKLQVNSVPGDGANATGGQIYAILNTGTVTINNGSIEALRSNNAGGYRDASVGIYSTSGTVNVANGTILAEGLTSATGIAASGNTFVNVTGGTITAHGGNGGSNGGYGAYGIHLTGTASLNVSGNPVITAITDSNEKAYAVTVGDNLSYPAAAGENGYSVNINGGKFIARSASGEAVGININTINDETTPAKTDVIKNAEITVNASSFAMGIWRGSASSYSVLRDWKRHQDVLTIDKCTVNVTGNTISGIMNANNISDTEVKAVITGANTTNTCVTVADAVVINGLKITANGDGGTRITALDATYSSSINASGLDIDLKTVATDYYNGYLNGVSIGSPAGNNQIAFNGGSIAGSIKLTINGVSTYKGNSNMVFLARITAGNTLDATGITYEINPVNGITVVGGNAKSSIVGLS